MRISLNGGGAPPCPYLYDEVVEIPVVNAGDPAPAAGLRQTPLVADWLADLFEDQERLEIGDQRLGTAGE